MRFRKKCLLSKLFDLDLREGMQVLTMANKARKIEIKAKIEALASLEEISWRQKSRAMFLKEGDNNTRFYHRLANSHRRANTMRGVEVDGIIYEADSNIQDQVVGFYKSLYQEPEDWRPTVNGLDFASLDEFDRLSLEREFDREEIIAALKEAEGDKAPGPNGFTIAFFQKCWGVIEEDVMVFLQTFIASASLRNL